MISRLPVFLLALFLWSHVPAAHGEILPDPDSSQPIVETQEIVPLALKFRQDICQALESSFCGIAFPCAHVVLEPNHPPGPLDVAGWLNRLADPCYSFMSLQL
jgi:hypothetical protein